MFKYTAFIFNSFQCSWSMTNLAWFALQVECRKIESLKIEILKNSSTVTSQSVGSGLAKELYEKPCLGKSQILDSKDDVFCLELMLTKRTLGPQGSHFSV